MKHLPNILINLYIILFASVSIYGSCNKKTGEVTVKLDGSKSFDPDGRIVAFHWRLIAGPSSVIIMTPDKDTTSVTGIPVVGAYMFELSGTDNNGATRYDTTIKTVTK